MEKLKKAFAKAGVTLLILATLVPAVQAFSLVEIKITAFSGDLYIDSIGVDSDYTHFYGKFCATSTTGLDTVDVKFTVSTEYTEQEINAPTYDDGCVTHYVSIDDYFPSVGYGSHTLTVRVDSTDELSELNELNNFETTTITIPLSVSSAVQIDPNAITLPDFGSDEDAEDIYINEIGIEDGDTKFYADVCVDGLSLDSVELNFIANGIHKTLQLASPPADGECDRYYSWGTSYFQVEPGDTVSLTATIDYYNDIEETDETNNTLSGEFTILEYDTDDDTTDDGTTDDGTTDDGTTDDGTTDDGTTDDGTTTVPDLYLSDVGITSANTYFYAKVCAIDSEELTTTYVEYEVDGQTYEEEIDVPSASTCETTYVYIDSNFTLDTDTDYTLTVTFDSYDEIYEVTEANNSLTYDFNIPGEDKDVYISDAGTATDSTDMYMTVCGTNTTGDESIKYNFNANSKDYTFEDYAPADGACETFYSNGVSYFSLDTNTAYTVTATADYYSEIDESDETNNETTFEITIEGPVEDLYVNDVWVEDNGNHFYAEVCGQNTSGLEDVHVNFSANGYDNTLGINAPSNGTCSTITSYYTSMFYLEEDTEYTLEVTVDYEEELEEKDESNNTYSLTFIITDADKDLYINDIGIEDDYTNFYAEVCGTNTVGTEYVKLNFNADTYDNTLGITAPSDGNCKTFYSWGVHNFSLTEDTEYTLTATVDYLETIDESDETNNEATYAFTIPSEVTESENDDMLFRPSLMLVRLGDLDGFDSDTANTYAGSFLTNDSSLVDVEFVGGVLLEEDIVGHYDLYEEVDGGITFSNDIYNHFDGYLFYVSSESTDVSVVRSLQLTVDGYVDVEITSEEDLGAYEIGDGTDNVITLELLGYLDEFGDDDSDEKKETILENAKTVINTLSLYAAILENSDSTDSGVATKFQTILDSILDPSVLISDTVTETVAETVEDNLSEDEMTDDELDAAIDSTAGYIDDSSAYVMYVEGSSPFLDVSYSDACWYCTFVDTMKDRGIVSGYKNSDGSLSGEFGPGNNVTIAELLKIALETAGEDESSHIPDLSSAKDHWAQGYVAKGEELGIPILDDSDLDINRNASRGEVIQTVFAALGIDTSDYTSSSFTDSSSAGDHLGPVEYAKDLDIIEGYSDGTFGYTSSVNRAEIAKIITNTISALGL